MGGLCSLHLFGKIPFALWKLTGRGSRGWHGAIIRNTLEMEFETAGRAHAESEAWLGSGLAGHDASTFSWSSQHGVLEMHVRSFKVVFLEAFSCTKIDESRAFGSMLEWHPRLQNGNQ